MKNELLIASSIITLLAAVPYIRNILRGKTKPNIVSWITWAMLTAIATVAELSSHEYRTAIFTTVETVEEGAIIILGLKYGYVKYSRFDITCQIGALSGFILWWIFNNPVVAIIASVTIDCIGALPTVRHSWLMPFEETWSSFLLSACGGILAIFALTAFNVASLAYPIWIVTISLIIAMTSLLRRKAVKII